MSAVGLQMRRPTAVNVSSVLPIIRTEWEERQTASIGKIAELEVAEAIAQSHRLLDLWAGYDDALVPAVIAAFLPEVLGCSLVEYLVFACYLEAFDALEAVVGTKLVVEVNFYSIAHNLHLLEGHALADKILHAIGLVECLES